MSIVTKETTSIETSPADKEIPRSNSWFGRQAAFKQADPNETAQALNVWKVNLETRLGKRLSKERFERAEESKQTQAGAKLFGKAGAIVFLGGIGSFFLIGPWALIPIIIGFIMMGQALMISRCCGQDA